MSKIGNAAKTGVKVVSAAAGVGVLAAVGGTVSVANKGKKVARNMGDELTSGFGEWLARFLYGHDHMGYNRVVDSVNKAVDNPGVTKRQPRRLPMQPVCYQNGPSQPQP